MSRMRDDLLAYAEAGTLSAEALEAALRLAGATPDAAAWRRIIDRLLVVAGALLVAVGVIFFVAFNWQAMGRFAKLGMLEALVLLPALYALFGGVQALRGRAALLFTVLILGGLLALVGQTYQTGADNYELFLAWALLALPWVLAGHWMPLWALWWTLVNLSLALYLFQVLDPLRMLIFGHVRLAALVLLNLAGLAVAELAAHRFEHMRSRWLARYCMALMLGAAGTAAFLFAIGDREVEYFYGFVLYIATIAGGAWFYQHRVRDLFPLACGIASLIVVVTAFVVPVMFKGQLALFGFTAIAGLVIGATVAATWWLRELNRTWQVEAAP